MNDEELKIVNTMAKYGGSFVKALSECFRRADKTNFIKLKMVFHEYWNNYRRMAK